MTPWHMQPEKAWISQHILIWVYSGLLHNLWSLMSLLLDSVVPDQTSQMCRQIWDYTGCINYTALYGGAHIFFLIACKVSTFPYTT